MMKKNNCFFNAFNIGTGILFSFFINYLSAQSAPDSLPERATLTDCINYALANQPNLKQALLDEEINRQEIRIALSAWLPQINADANIQHNIELPVSIIPNLSNPTGPRSEVKIGLLNTSSVLLSATQTIYSNDLFFAGKTARDIRLRAAQNTQGSKIDLIVNVSKAFYDVLLTKQQIIVLDEDIQRLEKNYKDTYLLYQNGLTDKTDYQRSAIALNNAKAQKKSSTEAVKVKYAKMKQIIGCPIEHPLEVLYDSSAMERDIVIDTLQNLNYNNRIEYKLLQTNLKLQNAKVKYYKWSFLPTISAFANDNFVYQNDQYANLYDKTYPNSYFGAKLSLPIFEGSERLQNIKKARLEYQRMQLDNENLENFLSTEYIQAMASYKSYLIELQSDKENIALAREIFKTVKFQYDKGIKSYLEVIVSETDLRNAQLNYLDTLFQVLSSKLDVQRALGDISIK